MVIRVLVVEDEPLLAFDIAQHLGEAGFQVVGPATSVARALGFIEHAGCDVAVLDVNLGRETSEPVAEKLAGLGTPFITLSGYSAEQHPAAFHASLSLTKPAKPAELIALLEQVVASRESTAETAQI